MAKKGEMALKEIIYRDKIFRISYEMSEVRNEKSILFLHGWGSNKELMRQAFGDIEGWCAIYVDMPGFGQSPNEEILTTRDYANIMGLFMQELGREGDVVVGHSFGGKVATLLKPSLLVLLSSAGIPVPKPWDVRAKIALYKLLKPFGVGAVRKYFVSQDARNMSENMYETFKNVVDEDFRPVFARYDKRALLFWGREDSATPLACGKEIASLMCQASLYELSGDHYFFLDKGAKIVQKIKEEYEKLQMHH